MNPMKPTKQPFIARAKDPLAGVNAESEALLTSLPTSAQQASSSSPFAVVRIHKTSRRPRNQEPILEANKQFFVRARNQIAWTGGCFQLLQMIVLAFTQWHQIQITRFTRSNCDPASLGKRFPQKPAQTEDLSG
jgi:hypothetical protein